MRDSSAVLPTPPFVAERLLAPEQAIVAYFARVRLTAPRVERVPLFEAAGRILAVDAVAAEDLPSHARSTMDGFAVASAGGDAPRRIVGAVAMGAAPPRAIENGETLRIPTGGALPPGADAVIPLEDVEESDGSIVPKAPIRAGDFQTARGADLRAGDAALAAGRRIGGPELGVLATLGIADVPVFVRPRLGIISTGDELVDPATPLRVGQVRDSNRYAIGGALSALGAVPVHLPRVADDPDALRAALAAALAACDGVVLTGGSSVGERDYTPHVIRELGDPGPVVHGLRVKPGKPTVFGAIGGRPIIGLPGNPTSSLMILEAVARPIVAACTGERDARATVLDAVAADAFVGRPGWTWFVPARLRMDGTTLTAEPLAIRSSLVSLPARASGYVAVGETPARFEAGERVRVTLFASGGAPIARGAGA